MKNPHLPLLLLPVPNSSIFKKNSNPKPHHNYKIKTAILYISLALLISGSLGCKKEAKNTVKPIPSGPYLYVGGGENAHATFWKVSLSQPNGIITTDTTGSANAISSIVTSGKDVYIVAGAAGYWKNQTFIRVSEARTINNIAISGTTVYTSGFDSDGNLAYFVNNSDMGLQNAITNHFPNAHFMDWSETGMALSGSNVLVTGNIFVQNWATDPAGSFDNNGLLWTNGNLQVLGPGGIYFGIGFQSTVGITVSGSDNYVAGTMPDSSVTRGLTKSGYWKNGVFNSLGIKGFIPSCITSAGNDIYIGGHVYNSTATPNFKGAYWKSGTFISIANSSRLIAIVINNNDVYALGIDNNNNNVVWKNGVMFQTLGLASNQFVSCMAVGN